VNALDLRFFTLKGMLEMKTFPHEFSDLLTPYGKRVLTGRDEAASSLFRNSKKYFVNLNKVIDKDAAKECTALLEKHLHQHLALEQRKIAADSITGMKKNYSEKLHKTMRIRTAFLKRRTARSYRAAERLGLLRMMQSESFTGFVEAVTGLKLDRDLSLQVICYQQGDYSGPHNDHHPEVETIRRGYIDFHVMFPNESVAHQYLVYEERRHFSRIVDVNMPGGISIYKLPFWHYTTPLAGKPGREADARRWLLLGTYRILG
jgi:hypothetical protein